jgi:diaminohydroxyphosphoribosylaminopyrimidine deaminase/5-amino-6-(5-phosphoribosylamino)uracil reductase
MRRALELAARGRWTAPPNPAVGAVVVAGSRSVGEGFHQRPGTPHAEVVALAEAGEAARGATLYVTLEPCDHHGRTPPCTEAILRAGVHRVVAAVADPHSRVRGRGLERLRRAGVEVETGLLAADAEALNRRLFESARAGRPTVVVKSARSLDGRTARPDSRPLPVTGPAAAEWTGRRRSEFAALLVGSGTLLADDPRLNARLPEGGLHPRQPARVVADARLRTPPDARLLRTPGGPVVIVTSPEATGTPAAVRLEQAGARLLTLPTGGPAGRDPLLLLRRLAEAGFDSILVEGGPTLAAALARADLVDLWHFWVAPRVMGAGRGCLGTPLDPPVRLGACRAEPVGEDLLVHALPAERT